MRNRRSVGTGKRLLAGWLCAVLLVTGIIPAYGDSVNAAEIGTEMEDGQEVTGEVQDGEQMDDADGEAASEGAAENEDATVEDEKKGSEDEEENDGENSGEGGAENEEDNNEEDKSDNDVDDEIENPDVQKENEADDSENTGDVEDPEDTEEGEDADQAVEGMDDGAETELDELLAVSAEERLVMMSSAGDIASGISNDIVWVIDGNGKLTVTGTGEFGKLSKDDLSHKKMPWYDYSKDIKYAKVIVSGMQDASDMFYNCSNIVRLDVDEFDTSDVTDMTAMFLGCSSLINLDVSKFDTSNVSGMVFMFSGCSSLTNLDVSKFDTHSVTSMGGMFSDCGSLTNLNVSGFDTTNVTDMGYMFSGCDSLTNLNVSGFDTINVTDMGYMFSGCDSLTNLNVSGFDTTNVTYMKRMFSDCDSLTSLYISDFDTSSVIDMDWMFYGCNNLINLDISGFDTSNVISMEGMFRGCSSLQSLDVSKFNTINVADMGYMFCDCNNLINLDVSGFDTYNVTRMANMFMNCSGLSHLDVSSFETGNVTSMNGMFSGCRNLSNLDVSEFDTSCVTDISWMFYGCSSLTDLDVKSFETRNVTSMKWMFGWCNNLTNLDLSNYNATNIMDAENMLMDNSNLTTVYTPYNLNVSVELPTNSTDTWYRSDGTVVTELPQNLSYSVALGKNYIPKEKEEPVSQLAEGKSTLFLFRDAMTGAPIKDGRVCIEEQFAGTNYYYPSKESGYVSAPLSKNCSRAFISTYFNGYEGIGGWADLSQYQSESGIYIFDLNPKTDRYIPKLPALKTRVTTSAPDVETDEGNISLFNMDLGFDMDFGKGVKSTVTYDEENRTIKVAISTDGKVSYDTIKKEYKASGSKSGKTLDEEFRDADKKMSPGNFANVDVKMTVKGYLEFAESGAFIEGGAIVRVKGSGATEHRFTCTAGLVYAKFEIGLSAEGKLLFNYAGGNLDASAAITLEPYAQIIVGAGWSLAHAEIGASGKLPVKITIPYKNDKESLSIDAEFELYGEVKFFCFGGKHTEKVQENIWPAINSANYNALTVDGLDMSPDDLDVLPRDYLSAEKRGTLSTYDVQNESVLTTSDSFRYSEISEDQGVFAENNVQYARLSDGTEILAWIHDFGDKSSVNRTTLVYSVNRNDGNGWSSITPVCKDTSTGDYYPSMAANGNAAYLAWNKASKVFDDDVDVNEIGRNMDVYISVFEDGTFSEPVMISEADNELIEFSPKVAAYGNSVAVAWLINSENDYHYTKGNNEIYVCEYNGGIWGNPICYAQNLNYVSDYDMDYMNGRVAVLYAEDADNRSDTQDGTVYYVRNGMKTMIGDESYHAKIVDFCDGAIYFSGGGKVYKVYTNRPSYIYDTGIETDNFSVVKSVSGEEAVLFLQHDGFASNVYASYLKDGIYTLPVPVVSDGSRVTNYVPLYNDDGTISIAYDEDEITETSGDVYGLTDMVIKKNMEPNRFSVDSELVYSGYDVAPGNTIDFATAVFNGTDQPVSKVQVSLTGSSAGEVYADILDMDIPIGEQQYISIPYQLPEQIVNQQYILTITPIDFVDVDLSDNSAVCELGFSDVAISDLQIKGNTITGKVTNIGYRTAEQVLLTMREDNQENSPVAVLSYEGSNLGAGESWEFSQTIDPVTFQNIEDIKYYLFSAETDSLENNYANNSGMIYSEPTAPTEIALDRDSLLMTEKTTAVIHAEVLPENVAFKDVVYTSDDNSIAVVDDKGNVYAVGEGSAVITAYTIDESQSAKCEVVVEGLEKALYTLSDRELELEIGDDGSIYVEDVNGDPVENVLWSSTNENILTIEQDGSIAAKGEGIAYLIAKVDDYVDVCIVRVSDHSISQLACEETTLRLMTGESAPLNIVVLPEDTTMEKRLTYVSDDETIATVDGSGLITAIAAGSTDITVSSVNGVWIKISVTVNAPVAYTVAFHTMGGTRVDSMEVSANKTMTEEGEAYTGYVFEIPDTYKQGYSFAGWFTDKNGIGDMLDTSTPITGDVIYYAGWQQNDYENDSDAPLPEDIPEGGIPENFWIAGIDSAGYVYTGQAIKPEVRVYDGDKRLKAGQDYTISYKNNVKANDASVTAKAPTITVKGKGNYSGTETATFQILPVNLNDEAVVAADITVAYNQKIQKKVPTLTYAGKKLLNKRDFTVSYPALEQGAADAYKAAGTYDILLTAKEGGNFTGTRTVKLIITDKILITSAKVSKVPDQTYSGSEIKPKLTVTHSKNVLEENKDYTVEYTDNIKPGKAVVTLTGIGEYAGQKKMTFNIKGTSLKNAEITGIENKVYNGESQKQQLTVTWNNNILIEGTDYEITYSGGLNAGKAAVTIKGINAYTGSIKKTFQMIPYDLKNDELGLVQGLDGEITAKYAKGGAKPKPILMFGDKQLTEGKDYTIIYKNNMSVTMDQSKKQPMLTIKGKGNFKGTLTKSFVITAKSLKDEEFPVTLSVTDKSFVNKAGKYISKPVLTDTDGKKLVAGKDYEKTVVYSLEDGTVLSNKSIVPANTGVRVRITGKGAYYGEIETTYRITTCDFSKAKIKIAPQIYSGRPITLKQEDITVKIGRDTLVYGMDFEIVEHSYKNNKNKGTASVTIIGKGNYGGTKNFNFKIATKRFIWFWRIL